MELSELDFEAIADCIRNENTSGVLDSENENGDNVRIVWDLKVDKFLK